MADSGTYDQATILRRQKLAEQMLADSSKPPVVHNWAQGLSHLANVGVDSFNLNRLDRQAGEARKADTAALMAGLGLGDQPAASGAAAMPAPATSGAHPLSMPAPSPQVLGAGGKPETPDAEGVYSADATMMPPGGGAQPRGIRNNNPLNIEAGSFTQGQPGFSGSDGRFARFEQPQQGLDAAGKLLDTYQNKYGLNTVRGIVNRWAPPGEAANNTPGYVASVAGRMGVDPDQSLGPEHRQPLIQAMGQFENGKPIGGQAAIAQAMTPGGASAFNGAPPPAGAMPPGAAPAGAGAPPQGGQPIPGAPAGVPQSQKEAIARLLSATPGSAAQQLGLQLAGQVIKPHDFTFQTLPDGTVLRMDPTGRTPPTPVYQAPVKPQFTQIGEDMLGNKRFGFVDASGRKVTDIGGQTVGGPGGTGAGVGNIPNGPDGMPLQGQDLLKHLEKTDPMAAAGVKGIIAGDLNMGGRNLQKLGPLAELVDPTMKQFDYQSRAKTRTDYTSGSSAKEITAINTAIGHADQLAGISPKLGGTDIMPGVLNPLTQSFKRNVGDTGFQDAKRDWDTKAETLATEVSKALNGGVPHVADKEHWRGILAAASSPTERSSALKSIMGVLESRLHAKAQAYSQGMGTTREPFSFLNPENEGKYQRLLATGAADQGPTAGGAPAAAATAPAVKAPAAGTVQDGYRFKGGNPADQASWEKV